MKKLCTIFAVLALLSYSAQAQSTVRVDGGGSDLAYEKGTTIFDAGIGFGNAYGGYYAWGGLGGGVPISASLELGLHDYFSVGPYAAFASYSYRYVGSGYRATFFSVGAKGSFHYVPLINDALDLSIDAERVDLYVSVYLGGEFYSDNDDNNYDNRAGADFGTVVGGRYMFNPKIGAYTEIGYAALAVWTIGVTLNL
uniref:Outer membrane protein beta-barrel domain-containing protein n=1 Tax=Roseihalotalea indica TaxID=2867963 RepID=A0AA49GMK0_9BACT|nr:hypothetical protein K4G66_31750 [Tunicatimonas sp. TK19036]